MLPPLSGIVKRHILVVLYHGVARPASAACAEHNFLRVMLQTLRTCGKASPSTHLARTRRRRAAELKVGARIHRQEAAWRAAETRSSPLCSTQKCDTDARVWQIYMVKHFKQDKQAVAAGRGQKRKME